jgi:hypothetical protein
MPKRSGWVDRSSAPKLGILQLSTTSDYVKDAKGYWWERAATVDINFDQIKEDFDQENSYYVVYTGPMTILPVECGVPLTKSRYLIRSKSQIELLKVNFISACLAE